MIETTVEKGNILVKKPWLGLVPQGNQVAIKFRLQETDPSDKRVFMIKPRVWGSAKISSDVIGLSEQAREDIIRVQQPENRAIPVVLDFYRSLDPICDHAESQMPRPENIDEYIGNSKNGMRQLTVIDLEPSSPELHHPGCPHHAGAIKIRFSKLATVLMNIFVTLLIIYRRQKVELRRAGLTAKSNAQKARQAVGRGWQAICHAYYSLKYELLYGGHIAVNRAKAIINALGGPISQPGYPIMVLLCLTLFTPGFALFGETPEGHPSGQEPSNEKIEKQNKSEPVRAYRVEINHRELELACAKVIITDKKLGQLVNCRPLGAQEAWPESIDCSRAKSHKSDNTFFIKGCEITW